MKNIFLIAISAFAIQACNVQHTPEVQTSQTATGREQQLYAGETMLKSADVPPEVLAAWNKNYSEVTAPQWYKYDTGYVVYYVHHKLQSRIVYGSNGNEVMRSHEADPEDVPLAIRDYMKKKYPGTLYGKTFVGEMNGVKHYDVNVEKDKWEHFDAEGKSVGN